VKRCVTCRRELDPDDFNRKRASPDGRQNVCRDCNRERARRYYAENRDRHLRVIRARTIDARRRALAYVGLHLLSHPCVDCGERDLRVLDFDHRPESGKTADVMRLVRNGHSIARIESEIARCDVRCRNCHARVTAERRQRDWRTALTRQHGETPGPAE
jgi:hypothetical protein